MIEEDVFDVAADVKEQVAILAEAKAEMLQGVEKVLEEDDEELEEGEEKEDEMERLSGEDIDHQFGIACDEPKTATRNDHVRVAAAPAEACLDGLPEDMRIALRCAGADLQAIYSISESTGLGKPRAHDDARDKLTELEEVQAIPEKDSESDETDSDSSDEELNQLREAMETEEEAISNKPARTENEVESEPIPIVDEIKRDAPIEEVGSIMTISRETATVIVKSNVGKRLLGESSVICLEDRTVIGAIQEIFGPVVSPFYVIRFQDGEAIPKDLVVGDIAFFSTEDSSYVPDEAIIKTKGTDASNVFDEEIADSELEFSDDEAEAAYKAAKKAKRKRNKDPESKDKSTPWGERKVVSSQQRHIPPPRSLNAPPRSHAPSHMHLGGGGPPHYSQAFTTPHPMMPSTPMGGGGWYQPYHHPHAPPPPPSSMADGYAHHGYPGSNMMPPVPNYPGGGRGGGGSFHPYGYNNPMFMHPVPYPPGPNNHNHNNTTTNGGHGTNAGAYPDGTRAYATGAYPPGPRPFYPSASPPPPFLPWQPAASSTTTSWKERRGKSDGTGAPRPSSR